MPAAPRLALVRPCSPRLAEGELTFLDRQPVDLERAVAQHEGYTGLLAELGLDIVQAPSLDEHPDGVFVEDAVVVVDDLAVLTRPGATSRRDEPPSLRPLLVELGLRVVSIEAPATLDGGDVLQVGHDVLVGRTQRTNDDAIAQLSALLQPLGRRVVPVGVRGALHLKTAVTALPDGRLVAVSSLLEPGPLDGRTVVDALEPTGADLLLVGERVVISASAPRTAAHLATLGHDLRTVELGEFEKLEAGPTCLSVLVPSVPGP